MPVVLPNSVTLAELSASPSFPSVNPKLIMESAVRIQAINVRSAAIRVRVRARSFPKSDGITATSRQGTSSAHETLHARVGLSVFQLGSKKLGFDLRLGRIIILVV